MILSNDKYYITCTQTLIKSKCWVKIGFYSAQIGWVCYRIFDD